MDQLTFDDLALASIPAPVSAPEGAPEPEYWREVVGYPGYLVSSLGRIWSRARLSTSGHRIRGRIMCQFAWKATKDAKYSVYQVRISGPGGVKKTFRVHQLVAEAFHGRCPAGMEVLHGPCGSFDNRASQLRYGTKAENIGPDRRRDGTLLSGGACWQAKLTVEIVGECRRRAAAGETQAALAAEFGVSVGTMGMAIMGRTWGSCTVPPVVSGRAGEKRAIGKITSAIVIDARLRHARGETITSIAESYGINPSSLKPAVSGRTWKSVPMHGATA
jgi:HNH endonuclease/NUMOD4 motif